MSTHTTGYVPAFHFHFLTPLYDWILGISGFGKKFRRRVLAATPIPRRGMVLDIGCGTGTMTRLMQQRSPSAEIIGIDPDPQILAIARRKAAAERLRISYRQGLAQRLPFPDQHFNLVTSSLMFHHLKPAAKRAMLREVRRVLKMKGTFVLVDIGKPKHLWLSPLAWLASHVEEGKENVLEEIPSMLREAGFHDIQLKRRPRHNIDIIVGRR